jgi:hypothetical protein
MAEIGVVDGEGMQDLDASCTVEVIGEVSERNLQPNSRNCFFPRMRKRGDFCHYKTRHVQLHRNGGVGEGFDDMEKHRTRSRRNRLKISFMRSDGPLSSCI